jgi:outer membrane protein
MIKAFATFPRLCLLALLLVTPAVSGASEAPKTTAPSTAAETKPAATIETKPAATAESKPTPLTETSQPPANASAPQQKQPEATPIKIGYVDIARFGAETEVGKTAREKIRKKSESLEKQMNTKQKQLEKQKAALQLKLSTLPPHEQEAKAKEFDKKVDEYRKFVQNAEKEMKGLEVELNRQVYQDIEQAAITVGKANNFAAITVKRDLLYVGSNVEGEDVTAEILKLLNAKRERK